MNVIVCVKQIPDPALPGELDPSTNTLKRDGKLIMDESDSYGVEMALQLVDRAGAAEVSLVSMATNAESTDGYTGTIPEQLAELLGLPSVTFAKHVEVDGSSLKVQRQTEAGYDEV